MPVLFTAMGLAFVQGHKYVSTFSSRLILSLLLIVMLFSGVTMYQQNIQQQSRNPHHTLLEHMLSLSEELDLDNANVTVWLHGETGISLGDPLTYFEPTWTYHYNIVPMDKIYSGSGDTTLIYAENNTPLDKLPADWLKRSQTIPADPSIGLPSFRYMVSK